MNAGMPSKVESIKSFSLEKIPTPGIVALLFVFILGVYLASPVVTVTDSLWNLYTAASIVREGNADLDEYEHHIDLEDDIRVISSKGHIYSVYPVATPIISAPFVWAANQYFSYRNSDDFFMYLRKHEPDDVTGRLEKTIASVIAALSAIPIYLIGRAASLDRNRAILLALLFAFATSMWSTASRAMWQHGPSVLFLSIALLLTVLARKDGKIISYAGFFIAIAYVIRPNNSLSVIFTSLYVLVNHRKYFVSYLLSAGIVAVPFMINNWMTYDAILPPYFFQLFDKLMATPAGFFEAFAGTMISPARGLFIFTPLYIFALYGIYLEFKNGSFTPYHPHPYLLAIMIGHWLVLSSFADWDGSWGIGSRYFVDITPYLFFFIIPVLRDYQKVFSNKAMKYAFISVAVVSTLIQFRCATSIYPFLWNRYPVTTPDGATYRDWDWNDLQFLRGFCSDDPEKGQAPACWFD